jgi:hypothetical protein
MAAATSSNVEDDAVLRISGTPSVVCQKSRGIWDRVGYQP